MEQTIDEYGLSAHTNAIIAVYQYLKDHISDQLMPNHIKLISSSDTSVVLMLTGSFTSHPTVYQCYFDTDTYSDIVKLVTEIELNREQSISMTLLRGRPRLEKHYKIDYKLDDYTVKAHGFYPDLQTIAWEKITPLNQISPDKISENLNQLIWDLGKALNGLHNLGYLHRDCRYDNIGIKNGKFILFDYNLSRKMTQNDQKSDDYKALSESLASKLSPEMTQFVPISIQSYKLFLFYLRKVYPQSQPEEIINHLEKMSF
jgi:tRNA A-37 threonylcarbamoyl transferase component Bud32